MQADRGRPHYRMLGQRQAKNWVKRGAGYGLNNRTWASEQRQQNDSDSMADRGKEKALDL